MALFWVGSAVVMLLMGATSNAALEYAQLALLCMILAELNR
jgi:hypothetical protein